MYLEKLSIEGKVALVTGGGTGLGKGMVMALAKAGADVALGARRMEPLEQTVKEVQALGRKAMAVQCDVTDSQQVNAMVEKVLAQMGHIDILVNNAGIVRGQGPKPIWDVSDADWRLGMDTNLSGAFYCARAVAKHMVERGAGKIINVSSGMGLRGARDAYMYCTAKGGVLQLTKVLALSLAANNIQVNAIVPGYFEVTPSASDEEKEARARRGRFIPVGRAGEPWELGPLAVFLASEASSYMTGSNLTIDGGFTIW